MAVSKLPLLTSRTVAVVSTRVWPAMLPPTISDAPTSEIAAPNPAIAAARSGSRASRTSSHRYCSRYAPSARICRRSPGSICCIAATVRPVTTGRAMMTWAMTMAAGV